MFIIPEKQFESSINNNNDTFEHRIAMCFIAFLYILFILYNFYKLEYYM